MQPLATETQSSLIKMYPEHTLIARSFDDIYTRRVLLHQGRDVMIYNVVLNTSLEPAISRELTYEKEDEDVIFALTDEMRYLSYIQHRGLQPILDVFLQPPERRIITVYGIVSGLSLRQLINYNRKRNIVVPESDMWRIVGQLVSVLYHLHFCQSLHRLSKDATTGAFAESAREENFAVMYNFYKPHPNNFFDDDVDYKNFELSELKRVSNHLIREKSMDIYEHACQIIPILHRDINPDNLYIDDSGHLVLCNANPYKVLTHEYGPYDSPELQKYNIFTEATDLYSVGLVLYELITCQKYLVQSADLHWCPRQMPNALYFDGYSTHMRNLIRDLLQPDPSARPLLTNIMRLPRLHNSFHGVQGLAKITPIYKNLLLHSYTNLAKFN